ncbi:MAG: pyridoxamine 5'-phosphate oxidase family protein [Ktedonobacteraceae bacterium]
MSRDYTQLPNHHVRRRDRAVEDEAWIKALLRRAPVGVLATVYDGQPFLNSNLFVYDETSRVIYLHTAAIGRTKANIEADERVCFTVTEMGRFLPADIAFNFSVEYASVVVFGSCSVITEQEQARDALHLLLRKYAPHLQPGEDYRAVTDQDLGRTTVYQIKIEQWSGKKKQADDHFPGAFFYKT